MMKELVTDKHEFYCQIKSKLKKPKSWRDEELYLQLINLENDIDELLSFVNDYPRNIERYADKLYTVFPEETNNDL